MVAAVGKAGHYRFLLPFRLELAGETVPHDAIIRREVEVAVVNRDIVSAARPETGAFVRFAVAITVPEREHTAGRIEEFSALGGVEVAIGSDCELAYRPESTRYDGGAEALGQHQAAVIGIAFGIGPRGSGERKSQDHGAQCERR